MYTIFYPGERIHRGEQHHVTRKTQYHESGAKWEDIKFKEYQTHQCKIFIYEGCD